MLTIRTGGGCSCACVPISHSPHGCAGEPAPLAGDPDEGERHRLSAMHRTLLEVQPIPARLQELADSLTTRDLAAVRPEMAGKPSPRSSSDKIERKHAGCQHHLFSSLGWSIAENLDSSPPRRGGRTHPATTGHQPADWAAQEDHHHLRPQGDQKIQETRSRR